MNEFGECLSILKEGIFACYGFFEDSISSVSDYGLTLVLSLLAISLVWRYLLSPLFK